MNRSQELREEREIAEQDKRWSGPRFVRLAIVTLIIAVSIIVLMARSTGCSLQWVP
jgi:hypothetical protein